MRRFVGSYSVAVVAAISWVAAMWEGSNRWDVKRDVLRRVERQAEMKQVQVMAELYPDSVYALAREGVRARANGDLQAACEAFERALALEVKDIEAPYYYYLDCLVRLGADPEKIDAAARRWRRNFPNSTNRDPRDPPDPTRNRIEELEEVVPADG